MSNDALHTQPRSMDELRTLHAHRDFASRLAEAGSVDVIRIGAGLTGARRDPAVPVILEQRDVSDDVAGRWIRNVFLTRYQEGEARPCFVVVKQLWRPQEPL